MNRILVCLLALSLMTGAIAQPKTMPADAPNPFGVPPNVDLTKIPLTADTVKRLLASFTDLRGAFEGYQGSDAQAFANYIQANDAKAKAETVIRKHGFADWGDWYLGFIKMMHSYMAYKMQQAGQMSQADLQKMEAMQNNPNMTAQQKQMVNSMSGMMNAYKQMYANVSAADLKVVASFAADIETTLRAKEKEGR
jgi:hypothetical protein